MRHILFTILCSLLPVFFGCGPAGKSLKVEYVEGLVTMDGEPVPKAAVTFVPVTETEGAEAAFGYSNDTGTYKLTSGNGAPEKGALAGEYRVMVSKVDVKDLREGAEYGTSFGYKQPVKQTQLLPAVYQDRNKTPLTVTVKKGKNKINIELTKETK